jgi:glycosyltransferase involved in cell wall biosynthesis
LRDAGCPYQIIFVDDGSADGTLQVLRAAKKDYPEICIISLSRNFGKEAALTAGLDFAQGDVVIPVDVDLQDPPELIHSFLDHWRRGFDVVYGVRTRRDGDGLIKRMTAGGFYRVFTLSRTSIPYNGRYRLMDRRVVDEIKLRERNRFMKDLGLAGVSMIGVPFERQPRLAGSTTWNYWSFGICARRLTSFRPHHCVCGSIWAVSWPSYLSLRGTNHIYDAGWQPGRWLSVGDGGCHVLRRHSVAYAGRDREYIGRMFTELKARPIYIIDVVEE